MPAISMEGKICSYCKIDLSEGSIHDAILHVCDPCVLCGKKHSGIRSRRDCLGEPKPISMYKSLTPLSKATLTISKRNIIGKHGFTDDTRVSFPPRTRPPEWVGGTGELRRSNAVQNLHNFFKCQGMGGTCKESSSHKIGRGDYFCENCYRAMGDTRELYRHEIPNRLETSRSPHVRHLDGRHGRVEFHTEYNGPSHIKIIPTGGSIFHLITSIAYLIHHYIDNASMTMDLPFPKKLIPDNPLPHNLLTEISTTRKDLQSAIVTAVLPMTIHQLHEIKAKDNFFLLNSFLEVFYMCGLIDVFFLSLTGADRLCISSGDLRSTLNSLTMQSREAQRLCTEVFNQAKYLMIPSVEDDSDRFFNQVEVLFRAASLASNVPSDCEGYPKKMARLATQRFIVSKLVNPETWRNGVPLERESPIRIRKSIGSTPVEINQEHLDHFSDPYFKNEFEKIMRQLLHESPALLNLSMISKIMGFIHDNNLEGIRTFWNQIIVITVNAFKNKAS